MACSCWCSCTSKAVACSSSPRPFIRTRPGSRRKILLLKHFNDTGLGATVLTHDRDTKFTDSFDECIESTGIDEKKRRPDRRTQMHSWSEVHKNPAPKPAFLETVLSISNSLTPELA